MNTYHSPVMLKEVLKYLDVTKNSWYIDCNLGGGGHTEAILKKGGRVIGIDLDPDAILEVIKKFNLKKELITDDEYFISDNLIVTQTNFTNLDRVVKQVANIIGSQDVKIPGVLFDLGTSSHQLETDKRGFSFNTNSPLDMRMQQNSNQPNAADLINGLNAGELSELFRKLGEEYAAKKIAKAISEYKKNKLIQTTKELADIILSILPYQASSKIHPATKVFQALRIAVNDELNSLRTGLPKALEVLKPGGRLVVISFHSLEDRIVKNYFRDWEKEGKVKILTDKPMEPTDEEIQKNPKSRSGKLRACQKIRFL